VQVSNANGWGTILHHFDLPEEFPQMQANNSSSVALMLSQYYMVILHPFEELYKKNIQEQQKKAQMPPRSGGMPGNSFPGSNGLARPTSGIPNMEQPGARQMNANGLMPQNLPSANSSTQYSQMHNQQRPVSTQGLHQISAPDSHSSVPHPELDSLASVVDANLLDQDMLGIKRKHDQDERETKRARQKTGKLEWFTRLFFLLTPHL
jgi:SWI/SNF chromatin-remodeling complex subunit SWI1